MAGHFCCSFCVNRAAEEKRPSIHWLEFIIFYSIQMDCYSLAPNPTNQSNYPYPASLSIDWSFFRLSRRQITPTNYHNSATQLTIFISRQVNLPSYSVEDPIKRGPFLRFPKTIQTCHSLVYCHMPEVFNYNYLVYTFPHRFRCSPVNGFHSMRRILSTATLLTAQCGHGIIWWKLVALFSPRLDSPATFRN